MEESKDTESVKEVKKPENTVFTDLFSIDLRDQLKSKNKLTYLSWAVAYEHLCKYDPDVEWGWSSRDEDEFGNARPWFDDGKTAWVETYIIIKGQTKIMWLPIMDFKNQAIPAEKVTTTDANKAIMRCFVKNAALFGLGLWVYQGEDLPESAREVIEFREDIKSLARTRFAMGGDAKTKALDACKSAQTQAFPELPDDQIDGNIDEIEDIEILRELKTVLTAIRKAPERKKKTGE